MLTVNDLITRAYRDYNLIPIGTTPTEAEVTETLAVYQSLVDSWFGGPIGILFRDWEAVPSPTSPNPSRYPFFPETPYVNPVVWPNPPPNVRIVANLTGPSTIYFPPTPGDGARMALVNVGQDFAAAPLTLQGNGRLIEGATSKTYDTNPTGTVIWFYRAELGNWLLTTPFTTDSVLPFSSQFDDFQIAALAIRRSGAYGKAIPESTVKAYEDGLRLLKARYWQPQPENVIDGAWRYNTYQSFGGVIGGRGGGF